MTKLKDEKPIIQHNQVDDEFWGRYNVHLKNPECENLSIHWQLFAIQTMIWISNGQ